MNPTLCKLPFFRALPALLLAVFISAQIGLIGHLHADDSLAADCLQCQSDNGQAVAPSSALPAVLKPSDISSQRPLFMGPTKAIYSLKARGPPALS
ncbi:hypothetical protein [Congregibacter sp.]|jgi:hypothetical protein|uniref:hypothetical protein n=1 Tax=Congregibacter sp. TaxID=2744308 RepID=UPI0039E50DA2